MSEQRAIGTSLHVLSFRVLRQAADQPSLGSSTTAPITAYRVLHRRVDWLVSHTLTSPNCSREWQSGWAVIHRLAWPVTEVANHKTSEVWATSPGLATCRSSGANPLLGLAVIANIVFVLMASAYVVTHFNNTAASRPHVTGTAHKADSAGSPSTAIDPSSALDLETDTFKCALYRLRNNQATIAYHHIHKCGGTSICRALVLSNSSLMGCRPEDAGKVVVHPYNEECNCNGHASTLPSPFSLGGQETEQLLARHKQQPPAAYFNEDSLANPAWFGPGAVQMVVLRQPVNRYLSHMFHVLVDDFKVVTKRNLSRANISEFVMSHTQIPTGANGWIADNAATRFLAGGPQEGPLTRADLMRAIRNLNRMDVVLIMEGLEAASTLLQELGLKPFVPQTRGGTSFSGWTDYGRLTPRARRHLEQQEQMDSVLYGIAKMRHISLLNEHANWKKAVARSSEAQKLDPASNPLQRQLREQQP